MKKSNYLFLILFFVLLIMTACEKNATDATKPKSSGLTNGKSYQLTKVANVSPTMVNLWFNNDKNEPDSLSNYIKGKYALLYIWKTNCGRCNTTIPNVIKVANERKNLVVLGISLGNVNTGILDYVSEKGFNFPNLLSDGATGAYFIYSTFGTVSGGSASISTPTVVFVNKDFTVFKKVSGSALSKEKLDEYLNDMMK